MVSLSLPGINVANMDRESLSDTMYEMIRAVARLRARLAAGDAVEGVDEAMAADILSVDFDDYEVSLSVEENGSVTMSLS